MLPSPSPGGGPLHQAFLWGLPLPIRAGPHAAGSSAAFRSRGRGSADQGQGGFGSRPSSPAKDAEGADAGGRQGSHGVGHAVTATGSALGDSPPPPPHTPSYWHTASARDQLQYWMLPEMDDPSLAIVCEVVNRYMRGERLEARAHGDFHLLPKR